MASRGGAGGAGGRGGGGRGVGGGGDGRGRGRGVGGGGYQQPYPGGGGYQQPYPGGGEGRGRGRGGAVGGYQQQPLARGDGGGRGLGGRGGGDGVRPGASAPRPVAPPQVVPAVASTSVRPPPQASSSSSLAAQPPAASPAAAAASALARGVERLAVSQPAPSPSAGAGSVVVPPKTDIPLSSKGFAHPPRPGLGTVGRRMVVRANHFLVRVADKNIYHYDVAINPEPKARRLNRVIMAELVKVHREVHLGGKSFAYDGSKSMYTAGELPFTSMEFVIKLGKERREIEYKVTIRYAGRADLHHLQQFIAGRQRDSPQDTIQALDVVLRETPSLNYVTVARSFYSTVFGRKDMGEGLECWRGYYQSLRPTQMGLSLNIDISSTSFFKPINVTKFVEECLNKPDPRRPLSDRDRLKLKKALRGVRVETTHQQGKTSYYKITGISSVPLSQLNFSLDEGTETTVVQYFSQRYKYTLQYTSWPCLQSGNASRPIYLPMEVCKIVQGQRYSKKLNDKQVTAILKATCERPQNREQSIIQMVTRNNYPADELVREFGIDVTNQMATVPARVLPPPMLKYHESGKEKTCAPSVGQWNMINKKMVNGATVQSWTCLNFSRMNIDAVHRLCGDLVQMCNAIGMVFNPRPVIEVRSVTPNNIEAALNEVHSRAPDLQLLFVILPDASGYYGKIKRVCETGVGIVSQCMAPAKLLKANNQYLENVSLKVNVKVGGRNTVLERALVRGGIPIVTEAPTIIFGADVTHPAAGEDSSASIAAVVASMDWPEITKYRALVSAQAHRQEIIQDLYWRGADNLTGGLIREQLVAFYQKNGKRKPERIVFYRDGVSDGQFNQVLLYEMDAIRKACASLEIGYLPPVTFVVVQKRHHTRLFPEVHGRRELTDRSGNILPGTVVDTNICHPSEFDFYLCSHAGIQGTSRPTHYHVLYDENHFTADGLQMLTNSLCYTYARCTRSVSVVPPAYYAHLAAFRARYYDEPENGSLDGVSVVSGGSQSTAVSGSGAQPAPFRRLPMIKDNVKDVMFFC